MANWTLCKLPMIWGTASREAAFLCLPESSRCFAIAGKTALNNFLVASRTTLYSSGDQALHYEVWKCCQITSKVQAEHYKISECPAGLAGQRSQASHAAPHVRRVIKRNWIGGTAEQGCALAQPI